MNGKLEEENAAMQEKLTENEVQVCAPYCKPAIFALAAAREW